MPADDKSEKARTVNGEGVPWYKVKRYGPLPGWLTNDEFTALVYFGEIPERLKATWS